MGPYTTFFLPLANAFYSLSTGTGLQSENHLVWQAKVDQLHGLIRFHGIEVEPAVLKRAEKSIKAYEREAICAAEEAFIKAVARKSERKTLPYFFGILTRIQQERDDSLQALQPSAIQ